MDWIELTIHTTTAGADIVSEALMAEGATGTMVEDRADIPDPDKPNGYWEIIDPNLIASMPEDVLVHAWFTPDSSFADRMQALRSRCDELHHMDLGLDLGTLEISTLNVHDEDWAEVEEVLQAIQGGAFAGGEADVGTLRTAARRPHHRD